MNRIEPVIIHLRQAHPFILGIRYGRLLINVLLKQCDMRLFAVAISVWIDRKFSRETQRTRYGEASVNCKNQLCQMERETMDHPQSSHSKLQMYM